MKYNGLIIFGEMGSGKDTLADLMIEGDGRVHKYGLGEVMRSLSRIATVDPQWFDNERSFMQNVADHLRMVDDDIFNQYALATMLKENLGEYHLRKEHYGEDLQEAFAAVHDKGVIPIIVGGRTWMDYHFWQDRNFLTVGINIDREMRLARLKIRDGEEEAANSSAQHNTERDVHDIILKCEVKADNNGSLDDLKNEAMRVLGELTK